MQLMTEAQVPCGRLDLVAFQGRITLTLTPLACLAVGLCGWWLARSSGRSLDNTVFAWFWLGFMALFALPFAMAARAVWRSTNWRLATSPEGVYVKLRSHLNWNFPADDRVVAFLPWPEIALVRKELGGWLVLELAPGVDTAALAAALAAERERRGPGRHTWLHYPVAFLDPSPRLQVTWRTATDRVVPSLDRTIGRLRARAVGRRPTAENEG